MPSIWESLAQGMHNAQPYKEQYIQNQYEYGALQAMTGGKAPDSFYAIEAYERTMGEVVANKDYQMALDKYYTDNRAVAGLEEFQIGLEELTKQYMEGQTEHFLHGFAPTASALETQYLNRFNKVKMEEQIEKNYNVIGDMFVGEAGTMLDSMVSDFFEDTMGYTKFSELKENHPKLYREFFSSPKVQARLTGMMRDLLSHAQKNGEGMGITKSEVSAKFAEFITSTAVEEALPEILEVFYIPDKDGVTMAGSILSGDIRRARQASESNYEVLMAEVQQMENAEARKAEEARLLAEKEANEASIRELEIQYNEILNEATEIALHENNPEALMEASDKLHEIALESGILTGALGNSEAKQVRESLGDIARKAYAKREEHEEIVNADRSRMMKDNYENALGDIWRGIYNIPMAGSVRDQIEAIEEMEVLLNQYSENAKGADFIRDFNYTDRKELDRHLLERKAELKERLTNPESVTDNVGLVGVHDLSILGLQQVIEPEELYQDFINGELTESTYIRLNKENSRLMAQKRAQSQALAEAETDEERKAILEKQDFIDDAVAVHIKDTIDNIGKILTEKQNEGFKLFDEGAVQPNVRQYFSNTLTRFRIREGRNPTFEEFNTMADAFLSSKLTSVEGIGNEALGDEDIIKETETILDQTDVIAETTTIEDEDRERLARTIEASKGERWYTTKVHSKTIARVMQSMNITPEQFEQTNEIYSLHPNEFASDAFVYEGNLGDGLRAMKDNTDLTPQAYEFYERYTLTLAQMKITDSLAVDPDVNNEGALVVKAYNMLQGAGLDDRQLGIVVNMIINEFRQGGGKLDVPEQQ